MKLLTLKNRKELKMLFVIQLADAIKMLIKKEGKLNLKGDHHEDAFLVTVNVDYKINKPQGVLFAIVGEAR